MVGRCQKRNSLTIDSASTYLQAKAFSESILSGDVVAKHSEDEVSDSKDIPF